MSRVTSRCAVVLSATPSARPRFIQPAGAGEATAAAEAHTAEAHTGVAYTGVAYTGLRLSRADQAMLDGAHGRAAQVAMRIIARVALLQHAAELVDISQARIGGGIKP